MALTSSPNPISADQIRTEFGATSGTSVRFGDYRAVNQTVGSLSGLPLDAGIPQSGPIGFGSFYSKRLNVVVDLYSGSAETRVNARTKYDAGNVTIIGGFKTAEQKPAAGAGSRIIANVNKLIGSEKTGRNYAALKTGTWNANTNLEIVVGSDGTIIGAGGNGGDGGPNSGGTAGNGGDGTSALAIQYPTKVTNNGKIIAGNGGGGGGAGAYGYEASSQVKCNGYGNSPSIGGGGGAGGKGYPAGAGGKASETYYRLPNKNRGPLTYATNGTDGSLTSNGTKGARGTITPADAYSCDNKQAISGAGGDAGSQGGGGTRNRPGVLENASSQTPGTGGSRGYAIIIDSTSGDLISFTGNPEDGSRVTGVVQ